MGQINEGLLVAFMFILILSMGVGNILMAVSDLVDRRSGLATHWLPLSWMILLLFLHLSLFWNTLDILVVEDWQFFGFLYVTAGPIILYIASGVMLPKSNFTDSAAARAHYFRAARFFFPLLALLSLWSIAAEYLLLDRPTVPPLWNIAEVLVLLALAVSRNAGVHAVGTVCYAILMVAYYLPLGLFAR